VTPEEIELLSELTIVIPTYNRPLELERSIEYWRDTPVTVHILDGSEKPWFRVGDILETSKLFYHHLPLAVGEDWRKNYFRRIRTAGNLFLTKYAVLCGDDDFFTISGLSETIARLESDMDIDAIVGRCAVYRTSNKVLWSTKYLEISNSCNFRSKNVQTRLKNPVSAPWIYYGVIRSELWRKLFALSFENGFSYPMTPFSVSRILDKALCRIVVLERLLWIRRSQVINPASTHKIVNQFSELLSGNRLLTRLKVSGIALRAVRYSSESKINVLIRYRIWKLTSHKKFRKKRLGYKVYKICYWCFSKVRLFLRSLSFNDVPILKVFNFAKVIDVKVNVKDRDLDLFVVHLASLRISYDLVELRQFEKLLLKPREELRLRADI
jgi:glycosyltransferase domain-containing protein